MDSPQISIILPTLNEADNLPRVIPRIAAALAGRDFEIIVVDDNSHDATPQVCAELAGRFPLRLHVRMEPKDGLSGAVLEGMAMARGEYLAVMDADLQHPPEKLPELLAPLESGEAEFVLGSRYAPGGSMHGSWSLVRHLNSRIATFLARPFSGNTHDPMSGFFALKRETYEHAERLTPLGYKVALELMCKCRAKNVREVPIHFSTRELGESKLTAAQQFKYLEHLSRLYDFYFPRGSPMLKFLIVVACGWLAAFGTYMTLMARGMSWVAGPSIAYGLTIAATAVFHFRYVRTQKDFLISRRPWRDFWIVSLCEWCACAAAAWWLQRRARVNPPEMFALAFGVATVARYVLRKELLQDVRGLRREPAETHLLEAGQHKSREDLRESPASSEQEARGKIERDAA
ncbi:MAG TPA: polyprenol monophosphomannose synthase [Tepidisphaeraceae bacterium]|nr:polyprenol monophosphomannose synthase [Tepidisphaeraceae bacterium]